MTAARPSYGWLSEESEDNETRLKAERVFIVDPIDGTYGFLKRLPHFTIVAAGADGGRPVAGAIYNPLTEEMFEAARGRGATLNGAPIHVSARAELEGASLLASRDMMAERHWTTPWPAGVTAENRASIAYRMALVAAGAFDAMISLSSKADWDLAAGDLIVREAGGRVTDAEGRSFWSITARRPCKREQRYCGGTAAACPAIGPAARSENPARRFRLERASVLRAAYG